MRLLSLGRDSQADDYPDDWERVSSEILNRDNYICQRCNHHSGPHAAESGRVLQTHHIVPKSEGGTDNGDNLTTLCLPCHGVQHPHNTNFDQHRNIAPILPDPSADPDVAFVNSSVKQENVAEYLDRKGNVCSRCWSHRDTTDLVLYPMSIKAIEHGNYPGEAYLPLCVSCLSTVAINDDSLSIQELNNHLIPYSDVHADVAVETLIKDVEPPQLWSYHPHSKFRVPGVTDDSTSDMVVTNIAVMLAIAIMGYVIGKMIGRP